MERGGEHAEVAACGALVAEEGLPGVEFEPPLDVNLRFREDGTASSIESRWIGGFESRVLGLGKRGGGGGRGSGFRRES